MSKPIQDSLLLVKQTQMEVNKNLADPQYNTNLLSLNALFQQIITRLVYIGGILEPETTTPKGKLGPMTSFMGKPLKTDTTKAADLDPAEYVKREYLQKVDKLYEAIQYTQPSIILNSYTISDDVLVLRGVAKRAGVEGFESKELNVAFIEEIVAHITKKKEDSALQKSIDDKSKNQGVEVTVSQEMIDASKFLQKEKVKPGDKVLQLPDGKYKMMKPEPVA